MNSQKILLFLVFFTYLKSTSDNPQIALITGVTGQDGRYLAEFLLDKGYIVHGLRRRTSADRISSVDSLFQEFAQKFPQKFFIHIGDITDGAALTHLIQAIQPDEIYNLAAQSHVKISFENPEYTTLTNAFGPLKILEAIRVSGLSQKTKFYQASSSEMYGKAFETPQNELTPFYPRSPYGVSKAFAHWIVINYREAYNIFACNGILFNHESPLRNDLFVTRKITRHVAQFTPYSNEILYLGNLNARRDWGYAKEYVEAMWMILQYETPQDWVIATGQTHTVREFVQEAFDCIGIAIRWEGEGVNERGYDRKTGKLLIAVDEQFFRPTDIDMALGCPNKAKKLLGWHPKTAFKELVKIMVMTDMK